MGLDLKGNLGKVDVIRFLNKSLVQFLSALINYVMVQNFEAMRAFQIHQLQFSDVTDYVQIL